VVFNHKKAPDAGEQCKRYAGEKEKIPSEDYMGVPKKEGGRRKFEKGRMKNP